MTSIDAMGISVDSKDSPGWLRRAIHPFVPAGFHDPVGLARRLLKNPDPAARFAIRAAAAAPFAMPMDVLMTPFERRMYRDAGAPTKPIVLVCGSARSGTSLAAQLLIRNLPVAFFDNLASVFPRSPLTARRMLGQRLHRSLIAYRSYYGRTSGWSAPNDALNLWDRWLGRDRSRAPERLDEKAQRRNVGFLRRLRARNRTSGRREEQRAQRKCAPRCRGVADCALHLPAAFAQFARAVAVPGAHGDSRRGDGAVRA